MKNLKVIKVLSIISISLCCCLIFFYLSDFLFGSGNVNPFSYIYIASLDVEMKSTTLTGSLLPVISYQFSPDILCFILYTVYYVIFCNWLPVYFIYRYNVVINSINKRWVSYGKNKNIVSVKKNLDFKIYYEHDFICFIFDIILTFIFPIFALYFEASFIYHDVAFYYRVMKYGVISFIDISSLFYAFSFIYLIPIYIAIIFVIWNCFIVRKFFKQNPTEAMIKKLENKKNNENNANYKKYIDIAGKKFFLKNYYIIRDLSFVDAMDSIEDKYSYEDKEKRVQAVKRIFSLNLQKFALEKIIQESTGDINTEIKAEAEDIYKKEFPEIITDTITESVAEETEDDKPKEIT